MVGRNFNPAHSNLADMWLGAPETYRSHKDTESAPLQVTKAVDMWSIGCIFSEVAVWAHHGWKRVDEYRRRRSEEIEARGGGVGEHIFHWDGSLLNTVESIHQDMLGKTTVKDLLTRLVLDHLVKNLLQHDSRLYAKFVFEKSKRLVKDCETRLGVSVDELAGSANGELVDSGEARTRTRSFPQVSHEHYGSIVEHDPSLDEPVPPDDNFTSPSPSSSRSGASPQRRHQKSASQGGTTLGIRTREVSQPGGQDSTVVPNPPPPAATAKTHEKCSQQHVQQRQEGPARPTLHIDEGHAWEKKKKDGGVAILHGSENLTSLDQRDHVGHVLCRLELANK